MAIQVLFLSAFQNNSSLGILLLIVAALIGIWFFVRKKNADHQRLLKEYEQAVRQMAENGVLDPESLDGSVLDETIYQEIVAVATTAREAIRARLQPAQDAEVILSGLDERTAAMLMAIVCNNIGGDPSAIRFSSIRALS